MPNNPELPPLEANHSIECPLEPLQNELHILRSAQGSFGKGLADAAQDAITHPEVALVKVVGSAAFGYAIGAASEAPGIFGLIGRSLGIAAGTSFLLDSAKPLVQSTMTAWTATNTSQLDQAGAVLGQQMGAFAFDTALQMPAAMLGGALVNGIKGAPRFGLAPKEQLGSLQPGLKLSSPQWMQMNLTSYEVKQPIVPETGARKAETTALSGTTGDGTVKFADQHGSLPSPQQGRVHFDVMQPKDARLPAFNYGVGIGDPAILKGKPDLSRAADGSLSTAARQLAKSKLPGRGDLLFTTHMDADALTAMAVLANRVEGRRFNADLVGLIASKGTIDATPDNLARYQAIAHTAQIEGDSVGEKLRFIRSVMDGTQPFENITARANAYQSKQAVQEGSNSLSDSAGAAADSHTATTPDGIAKAEILRPTERDNRIARPTTLPDKVHFAFIKPKDAQLPVFDFGVGIGEATILKGKPDLSPGADGSLASAAANLEKANLPKRGQVISATRMDVDTMTALAVLANRVEGRKVHSGLVEMVATKGAVEGSPELVAPYQAIAQTTRAPGYSFGEKVRFIRSVLDGSQPPDNITARANQYRSYLAELEEAAEKARARAASEAAALNPKESNFDLPRDLSGRLWYDFVQANQSRTEFDVALGISRQELHNDATEIIDATGNKTTLDVVMGMDESQVPGSQQSIGMLVHDANRITAAALLDLKAQYYPIKNTALLELINRNGKLPELVPEPERANTVLAYKAIDTISNVPSLSLRAKIGAVKEILSGYHNPAVLLAINERWNIHSTADQPLQYVRVTANKPKRIDFGVEITDPKLLPEGVTNLDHHGADTPADMPSAIQQALALKDEELPARGARIGIQKPDADALGAVAVIANRLDKLPVNERLVEALGLRDRGVTMELSDKDADIVDAFNAIRSYARNDRFNIQQRITAIREILAGHADTRNLAAISDSLTAGVKRRRHEVAAHSNLREILPGKLATMISTKSLYFESRQFATEHSAVALLDTPNLSKGTHKYEIVSRLGDPSAEHMEEALRTLQNIERGWAGRPNIIVSPYGSRLAPDTVLSILQHYIEKPNEPLVIDYKAHKSDYSQEQRALIRSFNTGDRVHGTVVNTTDFGAFVDLGSHVTALVHKTELSSDPDKAPSEVVKVGEQREFEVINRDEEQKRVGLSLLKVETPRFMEQLSVGQQLQGRIANLKEFGAFVDVGGPVQGLLLPSRMPAGVRWSDLKTGDELPLQVLSLDKQAGKFLLGARLSHLTPSDTTIKT